MRRRFLLIPALLLVPLAIAACGDDDTNDDDPANGDNGAPTDGFDDDTNGFDDDTNGLGDDSNGSGDGELGDGDGAGDGSGEEVYDFSDAESTENGVLYIDEAVGDGEESTADSEVEIHYQGMLVDGTLFDSSHVRGAPEVFPLAEVIPGFAEGVVGMQEGGSRVMLVPSELGYGEQGFPDVIPPDADLIFEVELIEVR